VDLQVRGRSEKGLSAKSANRFPTFCCGREKVLISSRFGCEQGHRRGEERATIWTNAVQFSPLDKEYFGCMKEDARSCQVELNADRAHRVARGEAPCVPTLVIVEPQKPASVERPPYTGRLGDFVFDAVLITPQCPCGL